MGGRRAESQSKRAELNHFLKGITPILREFPFMEMIKMGF